MGLNYQQKTKTGNVQSIIVKVYYKAEFYYKHKWDKIHSLSLLVVKLN